MYVYPYVSDCNKPNFRYSCTYTRPSPDHARNQRNKSMPVLRYKAASKPSKSSSIIHHPSSMIIIIHDHHDHHHHHHHHHPPSSTTYSAISDHEKKGLNLTFFLSNICHPHWLNQTITLHMAKGPPPWFLSIPRWLLGLPTTSGGIPGKAPQQRVIMERQRSLSTWERERDHGNVESFESWLMVDNLDLLLRWVEKNPQMVVRNGDLPW